MEPDPLRRLLDRDAIREVLNRFCRAIDRADADLMATVYHPDARETHGDYDGDAIGFCERALHNVQQRFSRMHHSLGTINIDLAGDVAISEAYFQAGCVMREPRDGRQEITVLHGRYLDRFERRDGDWRIAHRIVVKDYRDVRLIDDPVERYPLGGFGADDPLFTPLRDLARPSLPEGER